MHFGIIIHPAPPQTQSVLFVVHKKASKELIQKNVSAQDKDYFDVTLGYFLHCNFVDAGNGLMSHYPVEKIEAKHLVGKCQESMVRVFLFSLVG